MVKGTPLIVLFALALSALTLGGLSWRAAGVYAASWESVAPGGAGPAAAKTAVVDPSAGWPLFHNPSLLVLEEGFLLGVTGGNLFGLPELNRRALVGALVGRRFALAAGIAALGDSLYQENLLSVGCGWRVTRALALGVALERGQVRFASCAEDWATGIRTGALLRCGGWRGALAVHRPPARDRSGQPPVELSAGLARGLPGGVRVAASVSGNEGPWSGPSIGWFAAVHTLPCLELLAAGVVEGPFGIGLRVERGWVACIFSVTWHPLLGETPEGGLSLRGRRPA